MAVTVDQANIGTIAQTAGPGGQTKSFNTTAAVASGAYVVVLISRFNNSGTGATLSISGGGLSWTQVTVASGSLRLSLFYALAASGLASGTQIDITNSTGTADMTGCAASYTGIDTSTPERANNSGSGSGTAWATGTIGSSAGDGLIGGAGGDGTLRTSTAGGDATERIDFNSASTSGSVTLCDDLNAEASDTLAGTWSGSLSHLSLAVAFIPASGGSQITAARSLSYDIINAITAARSLSYDIQGQVTAVRALSYDILNAVLASRSLSYDIANNVQAQRALSYDILNAVLKSVGLSYDILSDSAVSNAVALNYDILNAVTAARSLSYDIVNAVIAARALNYDIANNVQAQRSLYYDLGDVIVTSVAEFVSATRGNVWQPDRYTLGRRR